MGTSSLVDGCTPSPWKLAPLTSSRVVSDSSWCSGVDESERECECAVTGTGVDGSRAGDEACGPGASRLPAPTNGWASGLTLHSTPRLAMLSAMLSNVPTSWVPSTHAMCQRALIVEAASGGGAGDVANGIACAAPRHTSTTTKSTSTLHMNNDRPVRFNWHELLAIEDKHQGAAAPLSKQDVSRYLGVWPIGQSGDRGYSLDSAGRQCRLPLLLRSEPVQPH